MYVLKHQNYNAQLQTHQGQVSVFFTGTQPDGISGIINFSNFNKNFQNNISSFVGPPNSDILFIELSNTFETVDEALKRVGTTLERDGTGNTLDTTPSSRTGFGIAQIAQNSPEGKSFFKRFWKISFFSQIFLSWS